MDNDLMDNIERDFKEELDRLQKEQKRLEGEVKRVNGMLSNERFISKAPEAKIAEEKEKLEGCRLECEEKIKNYSKGKRTSFRFRLS